MTNSNISIVIPTKQNRANVRKLVSTFPSYQKILIVESDPETLHDFSDSPNISVHYFEWNREYPKKRNWVLLNKLISTSWVLFLDDDEYVSSKLYEEILKKTVTTQKKYSAFKLRYTVRFDGTEMSLGIPQQKLALFKVGEYLFEKTPISKNDKFDMEVHEHPIPMKNNNRIGRLKYYANHDEKLSAEQMVNKHIQYANWEITRLNDVNFDKLKFRQRVKYRLIVKRYFSILYWIIDYIIFLRILHGVNGLKYSIIKFLYFSVIYEKLSEKNAKN